MRLFVSIFIFHTYLFSSDIPLEELPFDNFECQVPDNPDSSKLGKRRENSETKPAKCPKINELDIPTDRSSKKAEGTDRLVKLSKSEMVELYRKAWQTFPMHFKWVEKNIKDEEKKIAFLSLFDLQINDKYLLEIIRQQPKSLVKNHIIVATSMYLSLFNVSSNKIFNFIMHVRKGVETDTSFKPTRPGLTYYTFIGLDITQLVKLSQSFKGDFSSLVINHFEPVLQKITGNKFPNQEVLIFLFDKYRVIKNLNEARFHIQQADTIYRELLEKTELKKDENDLIKLVQELKAETHEKVALLSLVHGSPIILQKIRTFRITLDTNSFIAAVCVYLGYFGVQSEHIYSFLMNARTEAEPKRGFTSKTPGTMYKNFCDHWREDYFNRDFSYSMVEIFEPLSLLYRHPKESFMHYDDMVAKHHEYQEKIKQKSIMIPRQQLTQHVEDEKFDETKKCAFNNNSALSQWIEDSIQDITKKCALYALITTEVKARNIMKHWVDVINDANSLSQHSHLIAGIIFLSHFEIEPEFIWKFIAQIRGENRINKREFGLVTAKGYYEKFVLSRQQKLPKPPKYLENPTFLNALNTVFLPLLRDLTNNPEAEF
jgi:hypothetical protein